MTTSKKKSCQAFTLVEVLVSTTLATIILGGTLSSFLMLGRTGFSLGSYNEMEAQARICLEQFGQDVRQAADINWVSATEFTLQFPTAKTSNTVTYRVADDEFIREVRASDSSVISQKAMISGVSEVEIVGYTVAGTVIPDSATVAQANAETKQLQLSLVAERTRATVATATNTVLSARFILRNKSVSF